MAKPNTEFVSQYTKINKAKDIIFLLDKSGSMRSVYEEMMKGVVNAINQLGPNDRFTVLLFDNYCKVICKKVLKSNTELVNECITKILAPVEFGETYLDTGFAEVIKILREDDIICENTTFITLTDGDTKNYSTCVQQLTELNQHFKGKLPNCWMIGAGSDYNANNVTGLAKLMKASFVYVEMSGLKDFFTKHVKLTAGIYVDFNLIEINTRKAYAITSKLVNFVSPATFLACFEIEVNLLDIKNLDFTWKLGFKIDEHTKTLTNKCVIEPHKIQFNQEIFARYLNKQIDVIYNHFNLSDHEKLQRLEEFLPYAKMLNNDRSFTLITASIQRLNPNDKRSENTNEAEFLSTIQSFNPYENTNYQQSQTISMDSFQKISARTFIPNPCFDDSSILINASNKSHQRYKKNSYMTFDLLNVHKEKIEDISRETNFITHYSPDIIKLDGPSDLERILLHTGAGSLFKLLKTLTEKTFSKNFNNTKDDIYIVKEIIAKTMLEVGKLFPVENRQEEKVIKLVQSQKEKFNKDDVSNAIPGTDDYIRNKTGVAPQFSVITAFLIGGLARYNKLPGLNSGSKLFHYRDTALTFKFHSWVIYNCRINDISHLLLIDSFYCKIFDLSVAKNAKEALTFYKRKGLKGILRNLYTMDTRFEKFALKKHYQLDSAIPRESLDCVPEKHHDKFKNEDLCPITKDVMLDPVIAIHENPDTKIKHNIYEKQSILKWKKFCKTKDGDFGIKPFTDPLHRQTIIKLVPCFKTSDRIFNIIKKYHIPPKTLITNYEGYKESYIEEKLKTTKFVRFEAALSKLKSINDIQKHALDLMFDSEKLCLQIENLCANAPHKMNYFTLALETALSMTKIDFKSIEDYIQRFKLFIILTNDPLFEKRKKELKIMSLDKIVCVMPKEIHNKFEKNMDFLKKLLRANKEGSEEKNIKDISCNTNILIDTKTLSELAVKLRKQYDKNFGYLLCLNNVLYSSCWLLSHPLNKNSSIEEVINYLKTYTQLMLLCSTDKLLIKCFMPMPKAIKSIDSLFAIEYKTYLQKLNNFVHNRKIELLFNPTNISFLIDKAKKHMNGKLILLKEILKRVVYLGESFAVFFKSDEAKNKYAKILEELFELLKHPAIKQSLKHNSNISFNFHNLIKTNMHKVLLIHDFESKKNILIPMLKASPLKILDVEKIKLLQANNFSNNELAALINIFSFTSSLIIKTLPQNPKFFTMKQADILLSLYKTLQNMIDSKAQQLGFLPLYKLIFLFPNCKKQYISNLVLISNSLTRYIKNLSAKINPSFFSLNFMSTIISSKSNSQLANKKNDVLKELKKSLNSILNKTREIIICDKTIGNHLSIDILTINNILIEIKNCIISTRKKICAIVAEHTSKDTKSSNRKTFSFFSSITPNISKQYTNKPFIKPIDEDIQLLNDFLQEIPEQMVTFDNTKETKAEKKDNALKKK